MAEGQVPVEVDDAIVLLLGAPTVVPSLRDRLEGITRLEKLIFLLERETPLSKQLTEPTEFRSHNFGPFSAKVYQGIDTLSAYRLIEDSADPSDSTEDYWELETVIGEEPPDPYATRKFSLTDRGRKYYQALISELPQSTERTLTRFKEQFGAMPLRQLVRYVYQRYPEYTDKSLIRDDILGL